MTEKLEINQTVWFIEHIFFTNEGLCEGTIVKIGTKYITVKRRNREFKFDRKTFTQQSTVGYKGRMYLTEEAYMEEIELKSNIKCIQNSFSHIGCKVTLEQTRKILEILEINEQGIK